jgi:osmotically-inducible protein OsmY
VTESPQPAPLSPYLGQHIRDALAEGATAELGIDVQVNHHGVFLAGTVTSSEQRDRLAAIAARASGGLTVHNGVVVVHGQPDVDVEVLS